MWYYFYNNTYRAYGAKRAEQWTAERNTNVEAGIERKQERGKPRKIPQEKFLKKFSKKKINGVLLVYTLI